MDRTIISFIEQVRKDVERCWSKETSHKSVGDFAGDGKSIGQCGVTSYLLKEYLDEKFPKLKAKVAIGDVKDHNGHALIDNHCWVTVTDHNQNWIVDITLDQSRKKLPVYISNNVDDIDSGVKYIRKKYLPKQDGKSNFMHRYSLLRRNLIDKEDHYCGKTMRLDEYLQVGKGLGKKVLVIGESPAPNGWRITGHAFVTSEGKIVPTGKELQKVLFEIDNRLDIHNISFTEIVKCFVGNNRSKLHTCAEKTWDHFLSQIEFIKPSLIILLGKKTTEIFNDLSDERLVVGELKDVKISETSHFSILSLYHTSPMNPKRSINYEIVANNVVEIKRIIYQGAR